MGRKCIDLTNKIFSRLTVLERDLTKPVGTGKTLTGNVNVNVAIPLVYVQINF